LCPGISTWIVLEPCCETCASDTPNALTRSCMMLTAVAIAPDVTLLPGVAVAL